MVSQDLNQDVIYEIIFRSSLETLGKCRLLNKECNRLTYESSFMKLHCQKSKAISGYFIQSLHHCKYHSSFIPAETDGNLGSKLSLDFLPYTSWRIEACDSTHGIMLCVTDSPPRGRAPLYVVCKPGTKQWCYIPKPKTRYSTEQVGVLVTKRKPFRYKIVRLSRPRYQYPGFNHLRCEIFDSEIWAWKIVDDIHLPRCGLYRHVPATSVCGRFHWLTTDMSIFSFCAETGRWCLFTPPAEALEDRKGFGKNIKLTKYQGKLALIVKEDDDFDFWVLEAYDQKSWARKQKISARVLEPKESNVTPVSFYAAEIAILLGFYRLFFYNLESRSVERVECDNIHSPSIFPFYSDLELIELTGKRSSAPGSSQVKRSTTIINVPKEEQC